MVETPKVGKRKIVMGDSDPASVVQEKTFPIVYKDEAEQSYIIIIDDDIIGWNINSFHIKHWDVDKKYLGKKFYDIYEQFIVRKK